MVIALVFAPVLIFSQNCGCQNCVTFDTLGVGLRYGDPTQVPGDVIMMECDIFVSLEKFVWTTGGTTFNFCETQNAVAALGPTPVMAVNNINLNFDFTQMGFTAQHVTFEFIDYGGNENISVNGQPIYSGELTAAPAAIAPGVILSLTTWPISGGTYGFATLQGTVDSLIVGGQEFFIDNICASPVIPLCVTWDLLTVGTQFGNPTETPGDWIHMQNNIDVYVEFFEWTGGGGTFNYCEVMNPILGFGFDPIMWTNNINLVFEFTNAGFEVDCVEFLFLDCGGNENISVNGEPIFNGELTAAPTNIAPGVILNVVKWPSGEGKATLLGPVEKLLVGGQEFAIDNICAYKITATDVDLEDPEIDFIPDGYWLGQNYPNPFNATTRIQFYLPEDREVSLKIINMLGEEIRTLTARHYPQGHHSVHWDGKNAKGEPVASGIYFYQMKAGDYTDARRLHYIR